MFNLVTGQQGLPIHLVRTADFALWQAEQSSVTQTWLSQTRLEGEGYRLIPNATGELGRVVVVCDEPQSMWALAQVAVDLPVGAYCLQGDSKTLESLALGWVLAQYQFDRYATKPKLPTLYVNDEVAVEQAKTLAQGVYLTRNLVNTPASDMMPENLADAMNDLAEQFSAEFSQIVGDELLEQNFPTIHMVGRASHHAPRLLDLQWGDESAPKLTLVGKGVCFDSGGLDLKPAAGMRLMKKDMGGAAHVLGLASMIMANNLPVRLRVLIPAVENAVAGNAFRPGDIVKTRKGLTVEIDNTDAEGRLVLCDALALAEEELPELIVDFATLTGAARVALGLELPGFYSTDEPVAQLLMAAGDSNEDAVWRLPLHQAYASYMKGSISDLVNCAPTPMGGSITAALYLQHFVETTPWVHFDVGAWNDRARPGRPKGGEAMGLRATYHALVSRLVPDSE